jgi:hypothetical protein
MNDLLFIDTNIYLPFYDDNKKHYKSLLSSLKELKDHLFIPKQVVYEVERFKYAFLEKSLEEKIKTLSSLSDIKFPEQISEDHDTELIEWEKKWRKLKKEAESLKANLEKILSKKMDAVANSEDPVSKIFTQLFKCAIQETTEELQKARERKERGNPPGKINNFLGDQICWEQILTVAKVTTNLWIISEDGDLFHGKKDKLFLKPFLMAELKAVNPKIQIHCFETLVTALESFNKLAKIKALPSKGKIQEIKKEDLNTNFETMKTFQDLQDSDLMKSIRKFKELNKSVNIGLIQGEFNIPKLGYGGGVEDLLRTIRGFPGIHGNDD